MVFILCVCVCVTEKKENEEKSELEVREKRALGMLIRHPVVIATAKSVLMMYLGAVSSVATSALLTDPIEPPPKTRKIRVRRNAAGFSRLIVKVLSYFAYEGVAFLGGVGTNEYNNYRTAQIESRLRRQVINCRLNNYGCLEGVCWSNCGPRLRSGDWCLLTKGNKLYFYIHSFIQLSIDS